MDDRTSDADAPAPTTPTARWTADGTCDACGAVVSWRWRDGERYVCADCKEW